MASTLGGSGGGTLAARSMLSGLLDLDIELSVLTPDLQLPLDTIGRADEAERAIHLWPPDAPDGGDRRARVRRWIECRALRRRLAQLNPDVVLLNESPARELMMHWTRWPTDRCALVIRNSPHAYVGDLSDPDSALSRSMRLKTEYPHWIFTSTRVAELWRKLAPEQRSTVHVVRDACDEIGVAVLRARSRADVAAELDLGEGYHVVCPASIQHRKGQDLLLACLPELSKRMPDVVVHLVGWTVPTKGGPAIVAAIERSPCRDHIRLAGHLGSALPYIRAADVVVLPTRSESTPLTVIEAMALRTPVVSTLVDGLPEMVEDRVTGRLVRPEDPSALVEAIAWTRDQVTEAMLDRAEAKWTTIFAQARVGPSYAEVIEAVTGRSCAVRASPGPAEPAQC